MQDVNEFIGHEEILHPSAELGRSLKLKASWYFLKGPLILPNLGSGHAHSLKSSLWPIKG